ncbi:MAG: hypothetical protein ACK5OI_03580 [Curvibacter sp.]
MPPRVVYTPVYPAWGGYPVYGGYHSRGYGYWQKRHDRDDRRERWQDHRNGRWNDPRGSPRGNRGGYDLGGGPHSRGGGRDGRDWHMGNPR